MRDFDVILFDAGGVLVLPDPTVLGPLLAYFGGEASIEVHARAHYHAMAVKSGAGMGEAFWAEYQAAYVRYVGVDDRDAAVAARALDATFNAFLWRWPIGESVAALRDLHAGGMPIGIVSNAHGQIEETLRRSGACQVGQGSHTPVRCVVDSHVVGVSKPDPRIFALAIERCRLDPARTVFIDDSLRNVEAGRNAGLHALHFRDPQQLRADLNRLGML